ncbi:Cell number regulator 5 [Cocos nucifera]|nr:Cell number regulator 5 [Cocos nucifera]
MISAENGESKDEIQEDLEGGTTGTRMRLMDYIPIYIPTVERGLLNQSRHEKRFLDFLRAHPSKDWFLRSGFVGRLSPFSFLRRNGSPGNESSPSDPARGSIRRRFRVPFVRKINWAALIRYFKNWIKNPANMAFLVWLIFVAAGLIMLGLLMLGILNGAIPSSSRRKRWTEVVNQILNALFTIMCLYQHPKLFHHLVLLFRWRSPDRVEIRKVYCKDGARRPHERAHMMLVVILLHITCFAQYVLCGLYWGYTRKTRPDWAENLCIGVGIASPVIAGLYTVYSPLGRRYDESETEEESQHQAATTTQPNDTELKIFNRRVVVTSPAWIGGLFDCWDDLTVCYLSFFCTFCVFGWNMERLGFGNMYVHMVTFILLLIAPFWVFNVSALNVDDDTIRYIVAISGIVLCFFGLLYGGFWRIQMRKRFKLPANPFCCGYPSVTDCMQWLFCWSCSLAQEVRTGNFYDIEDDSFYQKVTDEGGRQVLVPLPREGGSGALITSSIDYPVRSYSCPPKIEPANLQMPGDISKYGSQAGISITIERSSTCGKDFAMRPPLPPLIQLEDN